LRNPDLENAYEASKKLIANECPMKNPNERFLYHGTGVDNAKSIMEKGFDNRYFSESGLYGNFIIISLILKPPFCSACHRSWSVFC
jgi:hypothetical protein